MAEVLVEHDYTAKEPNELSIVKGDVIRDVIKKQDGWFEGILRDRRGLFPDNFVRILDKSGPVTLRHKKDAARIRQCRVIFSYRQDHEDELNLSVGDVIDIVGEEEEGWWRGVLKGKEGVFPSNFVEEISVVSPFPASNNNSNSSASIASAISSVNTGVGVSNVHGNSTNNASSGSKTSGGLVASNPATTGLSSGISNASLINKSSGVSSGNSSGATGVGVGSSAAGGSRGGSRSGSKENLAGGGDNNYYSVRAGLGGVPSDAAVGGGIPTPAPSLPAKAPKILCEVKFAYTAQNEDELSIKEGDLITLISKDGQDPGWWRGELNGVVGVFPDNFVTILPTSALPSSVGSTDLTTTTEDNKTNNFNKTNIKSPHGTSVEPLSGAGVPIKPSTITAQRKSHQEIPNSASSVFSNSSDKISVSSNPAAANTNNSNNINNNNSNNSNHNISSVKPQQPPPAVPSKKPSIPVKKSPSGSSAHSLLNSSVNSSSSSGEKSSGGGGGIFYGLKKKIADVVDGATGSKSMSLSLNKTETVTSESGAQDNNVFDDVVRRPLLADVRASRPKAPGRRLPTTAIFKDSEPGIMNGSAEHSIVDGLTTTNTSSLPLGNVVQQQGGGSSSPEIDTTDSKPKLREWEKHKAPWLAEMKLNQAKRTSTSPGPPEHKLKLTPTPTNEKIIADISTSTTLVEEQQKSGNSVTTTTTTTKTITSSSSLSGSILTANFEKFEKSEKLEKDSLNSAIHSVVSQQQQQHQQDSLATVSSHTNKSAFLSNRLSQRTPSSEFLNSSYHQGAPSTTTTSTSGTSSNTTSSAATNNSNNIGGSTKSIGVTPLMRNRPPGVTMPTRPQTIHSLMSTSSSNSTTSTGGSSSSSSSTSVTTNESSSANLQQHHHKSGTSSPAGSSVAGSSRMSPLGHNKRPATMIPSAAGNGNNSGSHSEEKAPSGGAEAATPENIISYKQYSELLDRIHKLEDLIKKREKQHSEAIEELKNKLQIEAELRMDLQVRLETYITESTALQQL